MNEMVLTLCVLCVGYQDVQEDQVGQADQVDQLQQSPRKIPQSQTALNHEQTFITNVVLQCSRVSLGGSIVFYKTASIHFVNGVIWVLIDQQISVEELA